MTTPRPPEASRAGINRYYHDCEPVGSSRHYGICLFTIEAFERGQQLMETPCVEAMRDGTCPALAMRQQERDAGEALYFVEADPEKAVDRKAAQRERNSIDRSHPSYQRGFSGDVWGSSGSQEKAKAKSSVAKSMPKKPKPGEMIEFDASKMVNDLMSEPRSAEDIKAEIMEIGKLAAHRRKQAQEAGETTKPSVYDYMTAAEKKQMDALKRELVRAKLGGEA